MQSAAAAPFGSASGGRAPGSNAAHTVHRPCGGDCPPTFRNQASELRSTDIYLDGNGGIHVGAAADDAKRQPTVRFSAQTLRRDAVAGVVTGLMAVPLTVGICLMSEFPVQTGLATVIAACCVSFLAYLWRPGNHVGVPGVAAGLAPMLALCVHQFGMPNLPWIVFLSATMQLVVWKNRWEGYILKAVPGFLVEGLLAGVGLKIALKFLPDTYSVVHESGDFWSGERLVVTVASVASMVAFVWLYKRFNASSPGVPYIAIIGAATVLGLYASVPMLHVEPVAFRIDWPWPDFAHTTPDMHLHMVAYAALLGLIDVIEQVMSNAAIEKIDPLKRPANSNNSLLVMWAANLVSSFFGGMTNLDGLAKSSTNRMAGALTKTSVLFVAMVIGVALAFPALLGLLPEYALAVLMIFTGWKMVAGLYHVAQHGRYEFGLSMFCGILVFRLGIFEGLLIALMVHSFIAFVVYRHDQVPALAILRKLIARFTDPRHPHATSTMAVETDPHSGGARYRSIRRDPTAHKTLDAFIGDWAHGINHRNLLSVVGTYDVNGLLWGTFAKELRAGHGNIKGYFQHLFELDGLHVDFDLSETRQYHDIYIRSGSYRFSYRKRGTAVSVPARYSFVCKREATGWYIVEHHSSEFPA